MELTTDLKTKLLERLREEFGDEDTMTPVIQKVVELEVGYNLDQVDRDPTWDDGVEDENWVLAWLEYYRIVGN